MLGGDRLGDFLKKFKHFEIIFKSKIGKMHENEKVGEVHFILAYKISEHWDQY